jgi:hypothetical protein
MNDVSFNLLMKRAVKAMFDFVAERGPLAKHVLALIHGRVWGEYVADAVPHEVSAPSGEAWLLSSFVCENRPGLVRLVPNDRHRPLGFGVMGCGRRSGAASQEHDKQIAHTWSVPLYA